MAQIAHHYKHAGQPRQWARHSEAAADASMSAGDDRTAAGILSDALAAASLPHASRTRMALKLGTAALFGGMPRLAIPHLERVLDSARTAPGLRGELRFSLARLRWADGDARSLHDDTVRAVEDLGRRPRVAARALVVLAAAEPLIAEDADDRLSTLERALELSRRRDDAALATHILGARAYVLLYLGYPDGWRALEELPWDEPSPEPEVARELVWACHYLAEAALRLGYSRRAESLLDRADRICQATDDGRFAAAQRDSRMWLAWRTGRWQGLEARARQAVVDPQDGGSRGCNELILGGLALARGDLEAADRSFGSVLAALRDMRAAVPFATAASGLAAVHLARGDARQAGEIAAAAVAGIREKGLWAAGSTVVPIAVAAFVACGEKAQAAEIVRSMARGIGGRDAPAGRAALAFSRGALAEADQRPELASRWFALAGRAWARLPAPYETACARERGARCLLATGDENGLHTLVATLEAYQELGSARDATRVRAELRAHGVTLPYPRRGGRKRYGDELSPREAEVARLAGAGKTNREIALTLFLSPRTVEKHVASALAKLGITSRKDLSRQRTQTWVAATH